MCVTAQASTGIVRFQAYELKDEYKSGVCVVSKTGEGSTPRHQGPVACFILCQSLFF